MDAARGLRAGRGRAASAAPRPIALNSPHGPLHAPPGSWRHLRRSSGSIGSALPGEEGDGSADPPPETPNPRGSPAPPGGWAPPDGRRRSSPCPGSRGASPRPPRPCRPPGRMGSPPNPPKGPSTSRRPGPRRRRPPAPPRPGTPPAPAGPPRPREVPDDRGHSRCSGGPIRPPTYRPATEWGPRAPCTPSARPPPGSPTRLRGRAPRPRGWTGVRPAQPRTRPGRLAHRVQPAQGAGLQPRELRPDGLNEHVPRILPDAGGAEDRKPDSRARFSLSCSGSSRRASSAPPRGARRRTSP